MAGEANVIGSTATGAAAGTAVAPGIGTAIGAGVGLLGGLISYKAANDLAETSKNASKEELAALKEIMSKVESQWETPSLDTTPLTPQETKLLQKYVPSVAQYTAENAPHILTGKGQQESITAQRDALQQLQARAAGGQDATFDAQRELASTQAAQDLKGHRENILRESARRGLGGSGQEVLAQMAAAGNAEQMARQESLQGAQAADQRRIQALQQMTGLAGTMRGQAAQQEQSNADILNSFNQRSAVRKQAYDQYVADQKNQATLRNIQEQQRISEANAGNAYAAAVRNQNAANVAATTRAANANQKLQAIAGMGQNVAGAQRAGTVDAAKSDAAGLGAIGNTVTQLGAAGASYYGGQARNSATPTTPAAPIPAPATGATPAKVSDDEFLKNWMTSSR